MIINRLLIRKHKSPSLLLTQDYLYRVQKCISSIELLENMPADDGKRKAFFQSKKNKIKSDLVLQRPYRIYWQVKIRAVGEHL